MTVPLDEYPVHQVPLSMRYAATSDRNCYDRCIYQAWDRSTETYLITGLGVYPNLGVIDAYLSVKQGDRQFVLRTSDALGEDRMSQAVGPYRIEVVEPLRRLRIVGEGDEHGVGCDLMWRAASPPIEEPRHVHRQGDRILLDACRYAQTGTWSGVVRVEGEDIAVTEDRWVGTRDRSWGIRPVGEPEPPGRPAEKGVGGFWWCWVPLRFEEFSIMVIAQEDADGHRILNEAVRVWPEATGRRPEQLGWPEVDLRYRSGTRYPEGATIHLHRRGEPLTIEIETLGSMALNVGCGYGGDPDWTHGQWRGPGWVEGVVYDLSDPAVTARTPFSVIDHMARATCEGAEGWGIFEHASIGRHDPSGFADLATVAP